MKTESVDIKYYHYSGLFASENIDGIVHIKQLPYLSVVQSCVGSYGIKIGNADEYITPQGGFFIAPSDEEQKITHYTNKENNKFAARFIFLDVRINKMYRLDDIFDFPTITDKTSS